MQCQDFLCYVIDMAFFFLRRELRALRFGVDELRETIEEHSHAIKNQSSRRNSSDDGAKNVEVHFDEKTVRDSETQINRQHSTQESIKRATWCAFIAACIYAAIATWQLVEMRKATRAATSAAITASESLVLDERAWISANTATLSEIKVGKPLVWVVHFVNSGKTFSYKTIIANHIAKRELIAEPQLTKGARPVEPASVGLMAPNFP